jgi:hypothetical protein
MACVFCLTDAPCFGTGHRARANRLPPDVHERLLRAKTRDAALHRMLLLALSLDELHAPPALPAGGG